MLELLSFQVSKLELLFYNALISIIPALLIAYVSGDIHKVGFNLICCII